MESCLLQEHPRLVVLSFSLLFRKGVRTSGALQEQVAGRQTRELDDGAAEVVRFRRVEAVQQHDAQVAVRVRTEEMVANPQLLPAVGVPYWMP